jgi:glycosyltransferase involved in cell wall biosynthesis
MEHPSPLDATVAETLRSSGGLVFLNTVFGGGAYRYLEYRSRRVPVLSIGVRNRGKVPIEWMWNGEKRTFQAASLETALQLSGTRDIHINHLVFAGPPATWMRRLGRLSKSYRLHMVVHDFFAVCPSVNLLDHRGRYCGIPSESVCNDCLWQLSVSPDATQFSRVFAGKHPEASREGIHAWRREWGGILGLMDTVTFPSASARDLVRKAYPGLDTSRCRVVPHEVVPLRPPARTKESGLGILEVCLVGEITDHKGARILDAMLSMARSGSMPIRFRVVGKFSYAAKHRDNPHLLETGLYHPGELQGILERHPVDVFLFPSIWPETFSYVVHEMMGTGLPILATRIGAHGEALANYPSAILVDDFDAPTFMEALRDLLQRSTNEGYVSEGGTTIASAAAMARLQADWKEAMFESMYKRIHHLEGRIARLEKRHDWTRKLTLGHILGALQRRFRRLTESIRRMSLR